MKRKSVMMLLASVLMLVFILGACSGANDGATKTPEDTGAVDSPATEGEPAEEELPPVELIWYFPHSELQTDYESVKKAVNEYIQPKINATLDMRPIPFGTYQEKMNAVAAGTEVFDLAWTSNWNFHYADNVAKGAFLPIDELLTKYAKPFYDSLPAKVWEDVKEQGKTYAVPNYQIAARTSGFVIQKKYADEFKLDVNSIKNHKDLEPFLKWVKETYPDMIPYGTEKDYNPKFYGYEDFAGVTYKSDDPTFTLVHKYEIPAFQEHITMLREWYENGYINKDAATASLSEIKRTGKVVVTNEATLKPGGEVEQMKVNGGNEVISIPHFTPAYDGVRPTMTAISKTSKHPERAMMLINLVNTDPYLFNLLAFGVEGKHYEKIGDNTIRPIEGGGYNPNANWVMGNVTNGYLTEGQAPDTWELTLRQNEEAVVPKLYGFQFDKKPVETELANLTAVDGEYYRAIATGTVDPKEYLPRFLQARKDAGVEKVIAGQQKQLDAWLKEKGLKQ